jgi:hypothetical protein
LKLIIYFLIFLYCVNWYFCLMIWFILVFSWVIAVLKNHNIALVIIYIVYYIRMPYLFKNLTNGSGFSYWCNARVVKRQLGYNYLSLFSFFYFLFSSCQNMKMSYYLFIISNLVIIFFIVICFLSFLIDCFFKFIPITIKFVFQIWFSFFDYFKPFTNWILFSI